MPVPLDVSDCAARFWAKVDTSGGPSACWPWAACVHKFGHGQFRLHGRVVKAHRVAYTLARGPIPTGLDIDHTCHNIDPTCAGGASCRHRRCCNPAHLEPVPNEVNVARGKSPSALHSRREACGVCGGRYEYRVDGRRWCRPCRNVSVRQQTDRNRAAVNARGRLNHHKRRAKALGLTLKEYEATLS
jgi:hypothetical protein